MMYHVLVLFFSVFHVFSAVSMDRVAGRGRKRKLGLEYNHHIQRDTACADNDNLVMNRIVAVDIPMVEGYLRAEDLESARLHERHIERSLNATPDDRRGPAWQEVHGAFEKVRAAVRDALWARAVAVCEAEEAAREAQKAELEKKAIRRLLFIR